MYKRTTRLAQQSCRTASAVGRSIRITHTGRRQASYQSRTFSNKTNTQWYILAGTLATFCAASIPLRHAFAESPQVSVPKPKYNSTASIEGMPTIYYDCSKKNMGAAKSEFIALLGDTRVDSNPNVCSAHSSTQWSEAPRGDLDRPAMIVMPKTTEEVSEVAKICHRRRIPMIAYSGGTSLEGTLAAIHGGVCIDFKLMNKVVALHEDDMDVVVEPAVGYIELNEQLAEKGLFFPPDPGPGAQIGGMISQGCSGTNAYRYGTVKDWILGLTVVLADGTIVKTRHRPRKSSAGYNLTQLMVSTEGTLGFITEASLKLTKKPENVSVAVAAFPNTQKAVETAVKVVQDDMPLAAMELLCEVGMRAVNLAGYCDKEFEETPHLFLKFAGSKQVVEEQMKKVEKFAQDCSCKSFEVSSNDEEASAIWEARKTILWSLLALKNDPSDEFISADTAVPISRLANAVETARKIAADNGMEAGFVGHVGDGNFHTSIMYAAKDKKKARDTIRDIQRLAIGLDGTVTGEHGIGLEFCDMVVEELGQNSVDLMRQVKLALDPLCLLNPDKLFKLKIGSPQPEG